MHPQPGDVLVSSIRATVNFSLSILPFMASETFPNCAQALARGHDLAAQLQTDLWRTEDQTHFVLVISYRSVPMRRSG